MFFPSLFLDEEVVFRLRTKGEQGDDRVGNDTENERIDTFDDLEESHEKISQKSAFGFTPNLDLPEEPIDYPYYPSCKSVLGSQSPGTTLGTLPKPPKRPLATPSKAIA